MLGPSNINKVPMKVKVNENIVVENLLFSKRKHNFSNLNGGPQVSEYDPKLQANKVAEKMILENNEATNEYLNNSITL